MKTEIIKWSSLTLITALFIVVLVLWQKQTKVAYVDTSYIYENFSMQKELNKKLVDIKTKRKNILDSLIAQLKVMHQQLQTKSNDKVAVNAYETLKREYLTKEKQFVEDEEKIDIQYSDQVWNQVNEYIAEYGKNNHYQYILGANGQGNLMFADEAKNISKEVIDYLNEKYNGKIK